MVVRVWRSVSRASGIARVIVATDDQRIAAVVREAGGDAMLTSDSHPSGTDRVAEVARRVRGAIYVNVQGDLPLSNRPTLTPWWRRCRLIGASRWQPWPRRLSMTANGTTPTW